MSGPKKDEVKWDCRKLHNEELHDLYSSPNTIWVIKSGKRRAGFVTYMAEKKNTLRFTAAQTGVRRPLGKFRRRWEDNIKMDIKETEGRGMD